MSKTTFAIIAAASAGAGAAATAAMYSLRSQSERKLDIPSKTISTTTTTISTNATSAPVPIPSKQIFTPPNQQHGLSTSAPAALGGLGPVDPAAMKDGDRKHSAFLEDEAVPEKFRAKLKDYFRSGYDRGHQVPAADAKWSQNAMNETFYLTNMSPQVGEGFNRDYWAHFEDFCRRLTQRYPSVRIVTGPLYLPKRDPADNKWYVKYEVIGNPPNVAVPTHFYKVIFAEEDGSGSPSTGKVAIGAFVLPNAPIPNDKPLADFEVPIEAVERASGLEFASKLPVQRRKRLCSDTSCALIIKDYAERQKAFGKPSGGR
ncbi:hypothetical protein CIB48_g7483 [Xylaria polymorpha]|nr:hypothetical protein CIB48_g7483 [Xylaria polymorpha]